MTAKSAGERYWLTRFVFLRALGALYLIGFLALALQFKPLFGADGLLPARIFLDQVGVSRGPIERMWDVPTIFWLGVSDHTLSACAWLGVILSAAAVASVTNAVLWLLLWALYLSFVGVGQIFYGYGWELMMLEAGFIAVFLCPLKTWRPFPPDDPPPQLALWLVRWMLFRVMLGAGLIKLRGDACWRDLSCLDYHFETQPLPNPLSPFFHHLPHFILHGGVLINHVVELIVPWFLFFPSPVGVWAALATVAFQFLLILSGNLSWLNYLTIALCIPCLDDRFWSRLLPRALTRRVPPAPDRAPCPARRLAVKTFAVVIGCLSIGPVMNLLSPGQAMNASFDPLHLVNTYGAFGSVGRERIQIVLQGTEDAAPDDASHWVDYEYKCQPVDPARRPCLLSPYQLRLDWQAWFLPFADYRAEAWLPSLTRKLLDADPGALGLFAADPFAGRRPRWVRAYAYEYRFARSGEPGWWVRTPLAPYMPPFSRGDPRLAVLLASYGLQ